MNDWLLMHEKTIKAVILNMQRIIIKNTVNDQIDLKQPIFLINGLKNELEKVEKERIKVSQDLEKANRKISDLEKQISILSDLKDKDDGVEESSKNA